jgi:hypothetical protein
MNVTEFLRQHAGDDQRFARFNNFDATKQYYTIQLEKPDGQIVMLRNPQEVDGALTDKQHSIPAGSQLLSAGTAFWNWTEKLQITVGIDIDTDDNHAGGLANAAFDAALDAINRVPWFEARRSSGGKGLHVFPRFNRPVEIGTRKESTSLAHAVLVLASQVANFDFKAAKDCCGGNMWIYKSAAPPNAYEVIKEATATLDVDTLPAGWLEIEKAKKSSISYAPSTIELTPEHVEIERHLRALPYSLIYNHQLGCFHIHTKALLEAHATHQYKGHFATASQGTNPGEPNGFMFPLPGGAFLVKRFGNAKEDPTWFTGPKGQYTYLNVDLPFDRAVGLFATNHISKGYVFDRCGLETLIRVTGIALVVPPCFEGRMFFVKIVKGYVQIQVEKHEFDPQLMDWTATGKVWQRSFPMPPVADAFMQASVVRMSEVVRAVATDSESTKWCIKTNGQWVGSSSQEVRNVLMSEWESPPNVMGRMRQQPYWLVYEPFKPEYLAGRRWNQKAPQLACTPVDVADETPTWDAIFEHIGKGFHDDVLGDEDCQSRGITSGAHYLKLWVKLLIEKPEQRTPYLFLTSRQNNTGKTSLGAAITHLINPGVGEINEEALVDKFTGELEGKVLCLIEELDLRDKGNKAYTKLKSLLTSKTLNIRRMRTDTYEVPNFAHFLHTANDAQFVPIDSEDLRVVMIHVPKIETFIESGELDKGLKGEAPSMLRKLLDLPLPQACGRFWLPVVQTSLKESVLSGLYDNEPSQAKDGLKQFASSQLQMATDQMSPQSGTLARYAQFCVRESLPAVSRMEFATILREVTQCKIGKKQKRVDGKQVWHYTGFALSC